MLDTSIVIPLRDGDPIIRARIADTDERLAISIITVVELEAGIIGPEANIRRAGLNFLIQEMELRAFGLADASVYGRIVAACGYSRRKVLDRMIAAQALVMGIPLVTLNGADFRDIPNLKLVEW